MSMDVYTPCPCGSGKKLKFCCINVADEMERITRLLESHQPRQALKLLDTLDRKHPDNPWAVTTRALVLIEMNEAAAARDSLQQFLSRHSDHDFATVLYATALFQADGLDAARKALYRAFQRGAKKFPGMLSGLAVALSAYFRSRRQLLAAREHLALALRFASEEMRQEVFVKLLEFDSEVSFPYLLRSAHPLPVITGSEEIDAEVRKAHKYAGVGCWNTAADVYEKLAAAVPEDASRWHCVGLCRAWDGDEAAAVNALRKASGLYADRDVAVECEALAQLLSWNLTPNRKYRVLQSAVITSVGRLLTTLDAAPRLLRMEVPPTDPNGPQMPTAIYRVVDQPVDQFPPIETLNSTNMPMTVADVVVFDADPSTGEPAWIEVSGFEGPDAETAFEIVRSAVGEGLTWSATERTGEYSPTEIASLNSLWAYPPKTPVALRRKLEHERWQHAVRESWPNSPLEALGGKTPVQASTESALAIPLLAAVYVLDNICLRGGYELDVSATIAALGVEPLPPVVVSEHLPLGSLSPLQWLRLSLNELTDEQLTAVINRAQLVHHDGFLYSVLKVALTRPGCLKDLSLARIHQTLSDLCRVHERRAESIKWLEEGRRHAAQEPNNFEQVWSWDLRELLMRLEDPKDPDLQPLIQKFVTYYSPKLPQMRPYLEQIFALAGLPSPWVTSGILTADSLTGAGASGGLWTPGSTEPASTGKLWIPS